MHYHPRLDSAVPGRPHRARSSCTNSAITWSPAGAASGSRCSRSASARSCSAGPTAPARAGRSAPFRSAATSRCTARRPSARRRTPRPTRRPAPTPRLLSATRRLRQRSAIVSAGPLANILFALALLAGLVRLRRRPGAAARGRQRAGGQCRRRGGFAPGDVILAIDDEPIAWFEDIRRIVNAIPGVPLHFRVQRGDARDRDRRRRRAQTSRRTTARRSESACSELVPI